MINEIFAAALQAIEVVIAFVLFVTAHALGVIRERNRKPKPEVKPAPRLTCGCGHHLAHHEGLGPCQEERQIQPSRDKYGAYKNKQVPCTCRQYTSDLPEDWFARDSMRELYAQLPTPLPAPVEDRYPPGMPLEGPPQGAGESVRPGGESGMRKES